MNYVDASLLHIMDPSKMNDSQLDAAFVSEVLGCKITWWPAYDDWCCACGGADHGFDQQCSMLKNYTTNPALYRDVMLAAAELGVPLSPHMSAGEIMSSSIRAKRG